MTTHREERRDGRFFDPRDASLRTRAGSNYGDAYTGAHNPTTHVSVLAGGGAPVDPHAQDADHALYQRWRRDYARAMDEDYRSWRQGRQEDDEEDFATRFDAWRRHRGEQSAVSVLGEEDPGSALDELDLSSVQTPPRLDPDSS